MYPLYLADEGKQCIIRQGGEGHLGRPLPRTCPQVAVHPQVGEVCHHPCIADGQVVLQAVLKAGVLGVQRAGDPPVLAVCGLVKWLLHQVLATVAAAGLHQHPALPALVLDEEHAHPLAIHAASQ